MVTIRELSSHKTITAHQSFIASISVRYNPPVLVKAGDIIEMKGLIPGHERFQNRIGRVVKVGDPSTGIVGGMSEVEVHIPKDGVTTYTRASFPTIYMHPLRRVTPEVLVDFLRSMGENLEPRKLGIISRALIEKINFEIPANWSYTKLDFGDTARGVLEIGNAMLRHPDFIKLDPFDRAKQLSRFAKSMFPISVRETEDVRALRNLAFSDALEIGRGRASAPAMTSMV